jgi:hypothetical protein
MLNLWQKTLLFIGDLLPLFFIGIAFSIQPFYETQFIIFSTLFIISLIGTCYWGVTIKKTKNFNRDLRRDKTIIKKVEDRGSIYTVYIVTYISVLPLMSKNLAGIISFGVILLIAYSLYINSDMLFYNPILGLLNYKFYKVEIEQNLGPDSETTEIYAISKLKIKTEKMDSGSQYAFFTITDFIYLLAPKNE